MKRLIGIITGMLVIIAMDAVWLGYVMNDFYKEQLGSLIRMSDGKMAPNLMSAFLVYVCMATGLELFVVRPIAGKPATRMSVIMHGAIFGLVLYGVYDFTNHAVIAGWTLPVVVFDVIWGMVICGVTAYVMSLRNTASNHTS